MNIFKQASQDYCDYATYVNSQRALPFHLDGFKPIQRRLLFCGFKDAACSRSFVKSASVCGITIARYHPHGEQSAYGTLVNMVRAPHGVFEGHGNFGTETIPAAAMRYTEVKLSQIGKELYLRLVEEAPYFENDLGTLEPTYTPTPIPYALLAGAFGIGVGTSTQIPQFDLKSLIKYVRWLLSPTPRAPSVKLAYPGATFDSAIISKGTGSIRYEPVLSREVDDDGRDVIVISAAPPGLNVAEKVHAIFKSEIASDQVFVRDESTKTMRVVVGRGYKVRAISDAQMEKRIRTRLTRNVTAKMVWATTRGVRLMGLREVLEKALKAYEKAHKSHTGKQIAVLEDELKLYTVAEDFAKYMMNNKKEMEIRNALSLTKSQFSAFSRRSLAALRDYKNNIGIRDVQKSLKSYKAMTVQDRIDETVKALP